MSKRPLSNASEDPQKKRCFGINDDVEFKWRAKFSIITNFKSFHRCFELLQKLLPVAGFYFSSNRVEFLDGDSSNTSMAQINLTSSFFDNYEFLGDSDFCFNIPLHEFSSILSSFNNCGDVHVWVSESEMLIKTRRSETGEEMISKVNSIQVDKERFLPNDEKFAFDIFLPSDRLDSICKHFSKMGAQTMTFRIKENKFCISTRTEIGGSHSISFDLGESKINSEVTDLSVTIQLKNIATLASAKTLNKRLQIKFGPDTAVVLQYIIHQGFNFDDMSMLTLWIAPMIEPDTSF